MKEVLKEAREAAEKQNEFCASVFILEGTAERPIVWSRDVAAGWGGWGGRDI